MYTPDLAKIKARLEANKEAGSKFKRKEMTVEENPIVKVKEAGTYNFRAVPYIHNKEIEAEPFCERNYHFNIPGNRIFYCVKNDGEKCPICEFVWSQLKENKGTEKVQYWRQFLPQRRVAIPGIIRGRENEGLKFLLLTTFDDKPGKQYEKVIKYLTKPATCNFLDPEIGFDLELTYENYTDGRQNKFGKFGFKDLELARESTPASDDPAKLWKELPKTMKVFDRDIPQYVKKTVDDAHAALEKWLKTQDKIVAEAKAKQGIDDDDDGEVVAAHEAIQAAEVKRESSEEVMRKAEQTASVAAKAKALLAEKMKKMSNNA